MLNIKTAIIALVAAAVLLLVGKYAFGADLQVKPRSALDANVGQTIITVELHRRHHHRANHRKHRRDVVPIGGRSGSSPTRTGRISTVDTRPLSATAAVHSRAGSKARSVRNDAAANRSGSQRLNSGFDSRDGSHFEPWKVELFEQFENWFYLGKT